MRTPSWSTRTARGCATRIGRGFAFHASTDGSHWDLIRYFALDAAGSEPAAGFQAQSPIGEGCAVRFDEIRYVAETLAELRDGS